MLIISIHRRTATDLLIIDYFLQRFIWAFRDLIKLKTTIQQAEGFQLFGYKLVK